MGCAPTPTTRSVFFFLRSPGLAARTGCAIPVIRHLTKAGGSNPVLRGQGSIGLIGAVRSGLIVLPSADDAAVHDLVNHKHNLGPEMPTWEYRLAEDVEHSTVRIEWVGAAADVSASKLLTEATEHPEEREKTVDCAQMIHFFGRRTRAGWSRP